MEFDIVNTVFSVIGILTGGVFLAPPKVAKAINIIGGTAKAVADIYEGMEKTPAGFKIKDQGIKYGRD